jgi:general secretion pathway protein H
MLTLAAGSNARRLACGFTLIELLVVLVLVGVATAGVSVAMRDSADTLLERDAHRLAAVLDAARAQARASSQAVVWRVQDHGFAFDGLPQTSKLTAQKWSSPDIWARSAEPVLLGPEPFIPAQFIEMRHQRMPALVLWVFTDGLRPFAVSRQRPGTAGAP